MLLKIILFISFFVFISPAYATITFQAKWGSQGSGNGQFNPPFGIGVDASGNVYVGDNGTSYRIQKFDPDGNFVSIFTSTNVYNAKDIAFDSSGNMYAADPAGAHYIRKFNSAGTFIKNIGGFNGPSGIDFDSNGNFYFSNYYENKVYKYNSSDALVTSWSLTGPEGVAVDSQNNVYVVSSTNNRVYKYTSGGVAVTNWGGSGSGNGSFNSPHGIAIDNYDNVYVVDTSNDRFQKFNSSGTYVDKFGSSGSGNGQFSAPYFVEVNGTGSIYIVDYTGYNVQKFNDDSIIPAATSTPTVTPTPTPTPTPTNTPTPTVTPTPTPTPVPTSTPTPTDTSTPTLSNVSANAGNDSAVITWTTNENSSSQVEYGLTADYGSTTNETNTSTRVTSHSVTTSDLKSCARYYFRVKSKDAAGNQGVSSQGTFNTTGCIVSTVSTGSDSTVNTSGGSVSLSTNDGVATVTAPNSYYSETTTIQINKLDSTAVSNVPSGGTLVNDNYFNLLAVSQSGTTVTTFDQPLSFVITYGSGTESSYKEATLSVYKYIGGIWVNQNCVRDINANTLTCTLPGFSVYGVFGEAIASSSSAPSGGSNTSAGSSPVCSDQKPFGVPDLFQIDTELTKATLFFTPILGNTKYYVSYSTKEIAEDYGVEADLGYDGVQSYTINSLAPNSDYYFKVRSQNGCMPGDWSDIKKASTKSYQLFVSFPAKVAIKQEQVLSAKTELFANKCNYTVKEGDNLWNIAEETFGDPTYYPKIIEKNVHNYPEMSRVIDIGWKLSLPCNDRHQK